MKRRQFVTTAGLAAAGAGIAMPAIAQSAPQITWRLASSFSTSLETLWGGALTLAEAVRQQSDGRFILEVHPAGVIAGALDVFDAVRDGRADCAQTALHYFWGKEPALVFATGAPFGMNARGQNAFFRQGGGNDLINEVLADHQLMALPAGNTGCQMGGWFRNEIKSAADVRGLKFRVSGFAGKILQSLGAEPAAMGRGQIAAALAEGTLDAASWISPLDDERLGLVKAAPYYYYPGFFQPNMAVHLMAGADKWNQLPPAYQAILRSACDSAGADMQSRYDAANPAALRRLAEAGAKLRAYPGDVADALWQGAEKAYRETAAADAKFKRVHDAHMDFRNDQYLWWQVAEYPHDNYLIRQRARG